ncbi:hypothetical protein ACIP1G_31935, partial [Pseudomonas sp. NPDC089392]|uniref:hypothetical protein n=1 Tax=Pseudomonas sp. NPDC089392 TaxID=3364459 RepID=UPI0037FDD4C3
WGDVSHGLYCCEQSESAFSSHHPFKYHHTSGLVPRSAARAALDRIGAAKSMENTLPFLD